MSVTIRCEAVTRRGRPCRNAALPQSDPPRCVRHRAQGSDPTAARQLRLPGHPGEERDGPQSTPPRRTRRRAATAGDALAPTQPHLPGLLPQGLDVLEMKGLAPDLQGELQEVRLVMYRLLLLWNNTAQPLTPEEARRLAALVFTGARTVAHLLNQQASSGSDARGWLKGALDQLAGDYDLDL